MLISKSCSADFEKVLKMNTDANVCQISTGVSFLDEILGGGQYCGATHGAIMPSGTGKSHLALMIAVGSALAGQQSGVKGKWLLISDHMCRGDLQVNALSFAARIPRKSVRETFRADGADGDKLRSLTDHLNGTVMVIAEDRWRKQVRVRDRSVDPWEIADKWIAEYSQREAIAGIVLDDTSKMNSYAVGPDNGTKVLYDLVNNWAPRWAKVNNCPVWLMHSANPSADSPLAELSHKKALDCSNFGGTLDVCVVGGRRETNTPSEVSLLQCCRNRFRPGTEQFSRRVPIKIDSAVAAIVEAVDFYEDHDRGTLIQRACSESIGNADALDHLAAIKNQLSSGKGKEASRQNAKESEAGGH